MHSEMTEIGKKYHTEHLGNCAQSVAFAYLKAKNKTDEEIQEALDFFKSCGGGRAENGLCGALFTAKFFAKEKAQAVEDFFKKQASGKIHCKEIRGMKIIPCTTCVTLALEALQSAEKQNFL